MIARAVVLVSVIAAAGCGGKPRPAAPGPGPGPVAGEAASGSTAFALDGAAWTIGVGGTVAADGEYGQTISTPGFELSVMPWPRAEAFVQTFDDQLESARQGDPAVRVLHQVDGGTYAFESVMESGGSIEGSVLVADPGGGDGAMCAFKLPVGADWHPALAACASIARADD